MWHAWKRIDRRVDTRATSEWAVEKQDRVGLHRIRLSHVRHKWRTAWCVLTKWKSASFSSSTLEHADGWRSYISYIRQWTKYTGYIQVWYYGDPFLIRRGIITDFISLCRMPILSSHCRYLSTIPSNVCTTSCRPSLVSDYSYIPTHHNSARRQNGKPMIKFPYRQQFRYVNLIFSKESWDCKWYTGTDFFLQNLSFERKG
jgi:hypothetical protein